jgi:hypothetical protein
MNNAAQLRTLKEERVKRLQMTYYQKNPLAWMRERLGEDTTAFTWSNMEGYESHQWDGDKDALANAWNDIAARKWVGVEAGTGVGKTYWLVRLVFWFLDVYKDSLVVTSAPKQDQLKLVLWAEIGREFHKFKALHPLAVMNVLNIRADGSPVNEADGKSLQNSWQAIGFVAGVGADEESANKARGFHRENMLIILEESSGMNNAVLTAFKNTCTGANNIIVAVGNPNSQTDPLHRFCIAPNVSAYRISSLDHPNVVLGKEIIKGAVTRESIDRRRLEYGEGSPLYAAMVRGLSPQQSAHSLIKLAWIEQCVNVELPHDGTYNAVGTDVANSLSGDKAALAWGQGNVLLELHDFQCDNASHLALNIVFDAAQRGQLHKDITAQRIKALGKDALLPERISDYATSTIADYSIEPEMIGIDSVGVGASTLQQLHNLGYMATALQGGQWREALVKDDNDAPMVTFQSLRAQMYWEAREDLRQLKISIQLKDARMVEQLKKELTIPRYEYRASTIAVEPKESIKKRMGGNSPNLADAFVYWNFIRKGYRYYNTYAMPLSAGS